MSDSIAYSAFLVDETPYCVWEWDLRERNLRFLARVDGEYFEYLARVHIAELTSDDSQRAAGAIRLAYHHALETFFALVCATLQAPDCVVGWVTKFRIGDLRSLVAKINRRVGITNKLGLVQVSWPEIAARVFEFSHKDPEERRGNADRFGALWQRLSHDFLNKDHIGEYNSLKHGFRTGLGGFTLRVGEEDTPGVAAPENKMKTVGGSHFGTSFFAAESIGGAMSRRGDPHFRVRQTSLNWDAELNACALQLVGLSIMNVVSFARILNGETPQRVKFHRPQDPAAFRVPWSRSVGVTSFKIDTQVDEPTITRFTPKELRRLAGAKDDEDV